MNTRFLETFVTLAELRNYRATARALHATAAAISQRIRGLEDELRTELIDRGSKEFRLTAQGEYLLGHARTVLHAVASLKAAAQQDNPVQGQLRLGVIETVVHSWLAGAMSLLAERYPALEVALTVDVSRVLHQRLLEGDVDMIVRVDSVEHSDLQTTALALYPVRWIARHDLLDSRDGLIRQVLARPILTFERGTAPQRALEDTLLRLAQQENLPFSQVRMTCSPSVAAMVQLVRDGYGVAAIPALFVQQALSSGEFVELALEAPLPPIIVSLCHRHDADLRIISAVQTLRDSCRAYAERVNPQWMEWLG